MVNKQLLP